MFTSKNFGANQKYFVALILKGGKRANLTFFRKLLFDDIPYNDIYIFVEHKENSSGL